MIKFDLERALAGDKVITRDGREVTQLVKFDCENKYPVRGVFLGGVYSWTSEGIYYAGDGAKHDNDLFMAPKKLSGFVNVWSNGSATAYRLKSQAEECNNTSGEKAVACIDLSQFEEGHGLCE